MVIWLVGLSGAGKTRIGREVYQKLKTYNPAAVFIDGDEIREIFQHDRSALDYSIEGRRQSAYRLHNLSLWLDKQGIDVICCAISMFPEVTDLNRKFFSRFIEVFIDVPVSVLATRDNKGLYQSALAGDIVNVVGVDISYSPPIAPDLRLMNSFNDSDIGQYVEKVVSLINNKEAL